MKKVYLLMKINAEYAYDEAERVVVAVFETKEKAEDYIKEMLRDIAEDDEEYYQQLIKEEKDLYDIEEYEVL